MEVDEEEDGAEEGVKVEMGDLRCGAVSGRMGPEDEEDDNENGTDILDMLGDVREEGGVVGGEEAGNISQQCTSLCI